MQRHLEFVQKKNAKEEAIDLALRGQLHELPTGTLSIVKTVRARRGGVPHDFYVIQNNALDTPRKALIDADDRNGAQRVCSVLNVMRDFGQGAVWNLVPALLRAGYWWPAWQKYQRALTVEGDTLRGARPKLRELDVSDEAQGLPTFSRHLAQSEIYDDSTLRPPELEPEGKFIDRVRLFEGTSPCPSLARSLATSLPDDALITYVLRATDRGHRFIDTRSTNISDAHLACFSAAGLAIPASLAPLDMLLTNARQSLVYAPIKAFKKDKGVPDSYDMKGYRAFYRAHNHDGKLEALLRESKELEGQSVLMPPAPWSWDEFQDFRGCFVEMSHTLYQWLAGEDLGIEMGMRFAELI